MVVLYADMHADAVLICSCWTRTELCTSFMSWCLSNLSILYSLCKRTTSSYTTRVSSFIKQYTWTFDHNFNNCQPIFKILSLIYSLENLYVLLHGIPPNINSVATLPCEI